MIDNNTLIKYIRSKGHKTDWPDLVNLMNTRLGEMKLGFPGIGNDHISLSEFSLIRPGDIFIYDKYFISPIRKDEAPIMLRCIDKDTFYIEGIGCGVDSVRDPDRVFLRYGSMIKNNIVMIGEQDPVFNVDVRPTLEGGPGYYYFFKSYRDFRL